MRASEDTADHEFVYVTRKRSDHHDGVGGHHHHHHHHPRINQPIPTTLDLVVASPGPLPWPSATARAKATPLPPELIDLLPPHLRHNTVPDLSSWPKSPEERPPERPPLPVTYSPPRDYSNLGVPTLPTTDCLGDYSNLDAPTLPTTDCLGDYSNLGVPTLPTTDCPGDYYNLGAPTLPTTDHNLLLILTTSSSTPASMSPSVCKTASPALTLLDSGISSSSASSSASSSSRSSNSRSLPREGPRTLLSGRPSQPSSPKLGGSPARSAACRAGGSGGRRAAVGEHCPTVPQASLHLTMARSPPPASSTVHGRHQAIHSASSESRVGWATPPPHTPETRQAWNVVVGGVPSSMAGGRSSPHGIYDNLVMPAPTPRTTTVTTKPPSPPTYRRTSYSPSPPPTHRLASRSPSPVTTKPPSPPTHRRASHSPSPPTYWLASRSPSPVNTKPPSPPTYRRASRSPSPITGKPPSSATYRAVCRSPSGRCCVPAWGSTPQLVEACGGAGGRAVRSHSCDRLPSLAGHGGRLAASSEPGRPPRPRRPPFRKAKTVEVGCGVMSQAPPPPVYVVTPSTTDKYLVQSVNLPTYHTHCGHHQHNIDTIPEQCRNVECVPRTSSPPGLIKQDQAHGSKHKVTYKSSFYKCMKNLLRPVQ
ncbi:uncharacterized protein [Panulirus ornatus]|uniref:uncharacterized protein n=1 Tax=Panulirus ornatus TaxID=150431 RepID=UPI003A8C1580